MFVRQDDVARQRAPVADPGTKRSADDVDLAPPAKRRKKKKKAKSKAAAEQTGPSVSES